MERLVEQVEAGEPWTDESDVEWMDVVVPWSLTRISAIGQVPEARAALVRQWPHGVPTPANGPSAAQMVRILDLLDAVEAAFSIPFSVDPRGSVGHTRGIDRGNSPYDKQADMEREQ